MRSLNPSVYQPSDAGTRSIRGQTLPPDRPDRGLLLRHGQQDGQVIRCGRRTLVVIAPTDKSLNAQVAGGRVLRNGDIDLVKTRPNEPGKCRRHLYAATLIIQRYLHLIRCCDRATEELACRDSRLRRTESNSEKRDGFAPLHW